MSGNRRVDYGSCNQRTGAHGRAEPNKPINNSMSDFVANPDGGMAAAGLHPIVTPDAPAEETATPAVETPEAAAEAPVAPEEAPTAEPEPTPEAPAEVPSRRPGAGKDGGSRSVVSKRRERVRATARGEIDGTDPDGQFLQHSRNRPNPSGIWGFPAYFDSRASPTKTRRSPQWVCIWSTNTAISTARKLISASLQMVSVPLIRSRVSFV